MQELSSLTGIAPHTRIRKILTALASPSRWVSPQSYAAGLPTFVDGLLSMDNGMAWAIPHFKQIQLNCEIHSNASARL
jgi:hypothetical protein